MNKNQNSEEYVLNHEYGYGQGSQIKKIYLRNLSDLNVYVKDVIENAFLASYANNILNFGGKIKYKISIEKWVKYKKIKKIKISKKILKFSLTKDKDFDIILVFWGYSSVG